ncbi:MAG: S1C family serine protease [Candidatus Izemoplasmatales bacterium]
MKKVKLIALALILALTMIACQNVSALETTTTTIYNTTTTIDSNTTIYTGTDAEGNVYYYSDYQDLIDQIYQDVYDDIYQNIYDDISAMVTQDLYDEIYAAVENNLVNVFTEEEVAVYLQALQNEIYSVKDLVDTSVIGVSTYDGTVGVSLGTGVIYYYDQLNDVYYLITNEHVVDGGDNYRVVFADESYVVATLLGTDAEVDIAVLSFSGASLNQTLTTATLGDSSVVQPGTMVIAAGNPQGYSFYGSMTLGIVAGVNRVVDETSSVLYIQHDASINAGNSGGPLFNLQGEVIGINVLKLASTDIEGMGFSIPINTVKEVILTIAPNTLPA